MKRTLVLFIFVVFCFTGCSVLSKEKDYDSTTEKTKTTQITNQNSTSAATQVFTTDAVLETTAKTTTTTTTEKSVHNSDFVRVKDHIPDIYTELRYATTNNFTGKKIYNFYDAWLRYGTVKKLSNVQAELRAKGYSLKIWDAYRPVSAQFDLWKAYPDSTYVANPNGGYSSHSYGNTIDVTMVRADGSEVSMPTDFDNFTTLADRNYIDCNTEAVQNAKLLEDTMKANGFTPYYSEWWHYTDNENNFGVDESFNITD